MSIVARIDREIVAGPRSRHHVAADNTTFARLVRPLGRQLIVPSRQSEFEPKQIRIFV